MLHIVKEKKNYGICIELCKREGPLAIGLSVMYYLKHEHECFIRYKTQGAAERFISDKARIASVLNRFKNDPFYTHLVTLFTKEF